MSLRIDESCLMAHLTAEGRHGLKATLDTVHAECVFVDEPPGLRFVGHEGAAEHDATWWGAFAHTLVPGDLYRLGHPAFTWDRP